MVDDLVDLSEELLSKYKTQLEIELYLNELAEPLFEVYWELEEIVGEQPFPYPVEPTQKNIRLYGLPSLPRSSLWGQLVGCGMHPYGWDGETADWEQT